MFTKIKLKIKIKTKTKTQPQSSLSKTPETNAFFATHKNYPFTINRYKTNTRCTTEIVCGGADPIIKSDKNDKINMLFHKYHTSSSCTIN